MCRAFVLMPFDDALSGVYEQVHSILENHGFTATRADEILNNQNVMKDIVTSIHSADLIVADLTDLNPNVMYELGLAHGLNIPVITITQSIESLPFDLRGYRVLEYSPLIGLFERFRIELTNRLTTIAQSAFGSPVTDHLNIPPPNVDCHDGAFPRNPSSESQDPILNSSFDDTPAGFFDHIADIEDGMSVVNAAFGEITQATEEVGTSITQATDVISHARETSSLQNVRVAARMAADAIRAYLLRVRPQRELVESRWPQVDEAISGVLNWISSESSAISNEQRNDNIASFLSVATSARSVKEVISRFREAIRAGYGMDRSLNRSIDEASAELIRLVSLIDRIEATFARAGEIST